jgi:N-acetylglucosaminyldiphosphoundecaprenol N-acetyl-beta-D-mannosaminyltransferase
MKANLGNISVSILNTEKTLELVWDRLLENRKTRIFFINANNYNISQKDSYYEKCLNQAEIVLNDGIGIELGARVFGIKLEEDMNGSDFSPYLLRKAGSHLLSVYLLGAAPGVVEQAALKIKADIVPDLRIAGMHHGYFTDSEEIIRVINEANVDILLVGMGVPQQEKWITDHYDQLNVKVVAAIGAYLDFVADHVRRAPKWMRAIRMEWFYRLLVEPRRLWRRYLIGNAMFFVHIIKNRVRLKYSEGGKTV